MAILLIAGACQSSSIPNLPQDTSGQVDTNTKPDLSTQPDINKDVQFTFDLAKPDLGSDQMVQPDLGLDAGTEDLGQDLGVDLTLDTSDLSVDDAADTSDTRSDLAGDVLVLDILTDGSPDLADQSLPQDLADTTVPDTADSNAPDLADLADMADTSVCQNDPYGKPTSDDSGIVTLDPNSDNNFMRDLKHCSVGESDWVIIKINGNKQYNVYIQFDDNWQDPTRRIDVEFWLLDGGGNTLIKESQDNSTDTTTGEGADPVEGRNSLFLTGLDSTRTYALKITARNQPGPYKLVIWPPCASNTDCTARRKQLRECNTTTGSCRECTTSTSCTVDSLGKTCGTSGYCECASDADCAGNTNGTYCDPNLFACTCRQGQSDCVTGTCTDLSPNELYLVGGWSICQ